MALIATIHADPEKGQPPSPANYHPYLPDPKVELPQATPELLKSLGFRPRKPPAEQPEAKPEATP
jgi:hypothetical protein